MAKEKAEKKERKKRAPRKFQLDWDEALVKKHAIERKKGQFRITIEVLRRPENQGRTWTAEELAAEIADHPDLDTRSKPKKIADYYVFELRNAGLIRYV